GKEPQRASQSAFRPMGVQGGLSSFVHRPGPLERCLHAKSSEDISNMKFQPSCMSSYWKRH
ncbi:hypothetical protein DBR06_SOUSAS1110037, partial [Sousa chinensis]